MVILPTYRSRKGIDNTKYYIYLPVYFIKGAQKYRMMLIWMLFEAARKEYAMQRSGKKDSVILRGNKQSYIMLYSTFFLLHLSNLHTYVEMELAVPCIMHGEMRLGEKCFTHLLREAVVKPAPRKTIETLRKENKGKKKHKRVNIREESERRKVEDAETLKGQERLVRFQLALNQLLSGKRIDVSGVVNPVEAGGVELKEVIDDEENDEAEAEAEAEAESEAEAEAESESESESEFDEPGDTGGVTRRKPKAKGKKPKRAKKSAVPLAEYMDMDTAEYLPVMSELQTSIRIQMTGNVPDHFKVIICTNFEVDKLQCL